MELVLSAIASGGLVGASDQYLCLLLLSIASKTGLVTLTSQMGFMGSWWFMAIVAVFWLLTLAPAYASLLSPGVVNVINTIVRFLSGFVVPVSGALMTLASVGAIAEMHPELHDILQTLRIFDPDGFGVGEVGWLVAGGGAVAASVLTGAKFLAKPAISAATGTTGTVSAPVYATLENIASVVLMVLLYVLSRIDPRLLVGLLILLVLLFLGAAAYAIYTLWRLGKGVGRVIRLIETRPKAGLSVVAEFLVWGAGWLIWARWNRGIIRAAFWALWIVAIIVLIPAISAALVAVPFVASAVLLVGEALTTAVGLFIGMRSARLLLQSLESGSISEADTVSASALSG
ncbi:MAG: DUF4126 domain-containing protein [Chloroflexi bacterium]|nr:DUF4126 domain-containing protein [Chloroflexota bacterium]